MSEQPLVYLVVAARPNFMKVAPILAEIERQGRLQAVLVHTGQHYDVNMSDVFFRDLAMRAPDVHLGVGSGSHAEQTGRVMMAFETLCQQQRPDLVLVVGDVNATLACTLVAAKLQIPVAHVEAGLRSGDRRMPEEINRLATDRLADLLFTTSRDADVNLLNEGVAPEAIHLVGNVMVDSLLSHIGRAPSGDALAELAGLPGLPAEYAVLTLHRPSNVDSEEALAAWVGAFETISQRLPLICPVHPRTRSQLEKFGLAGRFDAAVTSTQPLGYLAFIGLMKGARLVITDSGGLQEETTVLGIPCLTVRDSTERPITITEGSNSLVGASPAALIEAVDRVLAKPKAAPGEQNTRRPEYWDGKAAQRIVNVLQNHLCT